MNYIDITQNKHTHCVKNNTVVITNREGIQGPPGRDGEIPVIGSNGNWVVNGVDSGIPAIGKKGEDGFSPYISAETGNWVDANGDTGVPAGGEGSVSREILFYTNTNYFPQVGVANVVYVDKSTVKMYSWNEELFGYVPYNEETETDIYCGGAFD